MTPPKRWSDVPVFVRNHVIREMRIDVAHWKDGAAFWRSHGSVKSAAGAATTAHAYRLAIAELRASANRGRK